MTAGGRGEGGGDAVALLIGPGTVVTMDAAGRIVEGGGVVVEGGRVTAVGPFAELATRHPSAERLEAGGGLVMPGITNAHTHLYGLFARGCSFPGPAPRSFRQILERVWWRLDRALTRDAVRLSALIGLGESLRRGVTAVNDHHASPNAIPGILDDVAWAVRQAGVRACLAYEVTDRNGPEGARQGIEENVRFLRSIAQAPGGGAPGGAGGGVTRAGGLLAGRFGLHASFTVSGETLAACQREAAGLQGAFPGFHLHLAEGPEDPADSLLSSGRRTVHRLAAARVLGPGTFVAHGVHLDPEEVALLAETRTVLTHQPQSNMGNAVGWARVLAMRERGVRVALGTDGYTPDMLETVRAAATLHSHMTGIPSAGAEEFARMLLVDNPAILGPVWGERLGVLEPGAAGDVVVLSYHAPTPITPANLFSHVVFGLSAVHVESAVVAGRVVLQKGRIQGFDEAAAAAEARALVAEVWRRVEQP